mmetsp:Transcript_35448/g.60221  ORF Transcript_35448/g.60221 Transcript_35448/m.60221 type:complete len:132 (+) Transcript_35448:1147-1542(+)
MKEIAWTALNKAKIDNQRYDSEILKYERVLKNMQDRMKTAVDLAKMFKEMDKLDKAEEKMAEVENTMIDVANTEAEMFKLQNRSSSVTAEVDEYLKKGHIAMGIDGKAKKKARQGNVGKDNEEGYNELFDE